MLYRHKGNQQIIQEKPRFSIRKYSVGVASVLIGVSLFYSGNPVQAANKGAESFTQKTNAALEEVKVCQDLLKKAEALGLGHEATYSHLKSLVDGVDVDGNTGDAIHQARLALEALIASKEAAFKAATKNETRSPKNQTQNLAKEEKSPKSETEQQSSDQVISNRKKRSASDRSRWQDRANGEPYQDARESYFEDQEHSTSGYPKYTCLYRTHNSWTPEQIKVIFMQR